MHTISLSDSIGCPSCEEEFDVFATIIVATQRNPYGSTTVSEDISEINLDETPRCPNCGNVADELATERFAETDLSDYIYDC